MHIDLSNCDYEYETDMLYNSLYIMCVWGGGGGGVHFEVEDVHLVELLMCFALPQLPMPGDSYCSHVGDTGLCCCVSCCTCGVCGVLCWFSVRSQKDVVLVVSLCNISKYPVYIVLCRCAFRGAAAKHRGVWWKKRTEKDHRVQVQWGGENCQGTSSCLMKECSSVSCRERM